MPELNPPTNEFEALAPLYLEILERLSDNEALKIAFYSVNRFFEDPRQHNDLIFMMRENDEDASRWAAEDRQRRGEYHDMVYAKERAEHLGLRANMSLSDLVEKTIIDGRPVLKPKADAASRIQYAFRAGWCWASVQEVRDDSDMIIDFALICNNNGATSWMVTTDEKTGQLMFGDRFHCFSYSYEQSTFIGRLGAGEYILDQTGRYPEGQSEKPDPNSKHTQAVQQIIKG